MASVIVNFYRTLATDGGTNDSEPGGGGVNNNNKFSKLSHRLPQHVLQLLAKRSFKQVFDTDSGIPHLQLGETKVLESSANISGGVEEQSAILESGGINSNSDANMAEQLLYLENLTDEAQCGPFLGSMCALYSLCLLTRYNSSNFIFFCRYSAGRDSTERPQLFVQSSIILPWNY